MSLLMRYLLRQYLRVLFVCLTGLASVYVIVDFVEKVRKFASYQAELKHVGWYFALKLPSILFQITPLAVLMSCLLTLAVLSRHNEITAMRSSGISLYRVAIPFLVVAQIISLLMLWASDALIPRANQHAELVRETQIERHAPRTFFQGNEIWVRLGNQTLMRGDLADDCPMKIYAITFFGGDPADDCPLKLHGITLFRLNPEFGIQEVLTAKELVNQDRQWLLISGMSRTMGSDQMVQSQFFDQQPVSLNQKPEDFRRILRVSSADIFGNVKLVETLSLRELASYVQRLREDGYNPARYATDLFGRIAFPFVCVIMALIGSSMSLLESGSRGASVVKGVGYSLLIGFLYWATHSVALAFGRSGVFPALLAGWSANLLFLSFAGYMFLRVRQ